METVVASLYQTIQIKASQEACYAGRIADDCGVFLPTRESTCRSEKFIILSGYIFVIMNT